MQFRTDRNRNPLAFTTDIAKQAKLKLGVDYVAGDLFTTGSKIYHTAKLLGNPIKLCIQVIDNIGFYTKTGNLRWDYIGIPPFIWNSLSNLNKVHIIKYMYKREGGTELLPLFSKAEVE